MKECRHCGDPIKAGERFCSPQCRLQSLGREDLVIKKDAEAGWIHVTKTARAPWRKD